MARTKRKKKQALQETRFVRPTDERLAKGDFRSAGAAVRDTPVIVSLHEAKLLSDKHFAWLAHYRDQHAHADHSPVRSCIDFSPASGNGPGVSVLSAKFEVARIEKELREMKLIDITRKIVIQDIPFEHIVRKMAQRAGLEAFQGDARRKILAHYRSLILIDLKFAAGYCAPLG
ncbi:hypothetical protein AB1K62_14425 [Parasphingorhabdus sp. JC815]|uniref:hypothetical protein n=1 Tax=Parasphingorhabdus sp. JC815 TaxID=3232140 RepID=UPI00345847A9